MRRASIAVLVLALAGTACGSSGGDRAASGPGNASASGASGGGSLDAHTADRLNAKKSATPAITAASARTKGTPDALPSGPASTNTIPLRVRMASTCVEPGGTIEATATTVSNASLSFAAAYSDNSMPPDFTYVATFENPDGSFTWRWVIRPTIPPGDALLVVVAAKQKKGASYNLPFHVAASC